jgi:hypothetical protein
VSFETGLAIGDEVAITFTFDSVEVAVIIAEIVFTELPEIPACEDCADETDDVVALFAGIVDPVVSVEYNV